MAAWASVEQAREQWANAKDMAEGLLNALLDAAQEQAEAYAPALADGAPVPARYTRAVILQAQDDWQNSERDGDVLGFDGEYAVRVRPLAANVKAMLRPPTGRPRLYKDAEVEP